MEAEAKARELKLASLFARRELRAALAVQRAYWAMKERVKQRQEREAAERAAELVKRRQEETALTGPSEDSEQVRI